MAEDQIKAEKGTGRQTQGETKGERQSPEKQRHKERDRKQTGTDRCRLVITTLSLTLKDLPLTPKVRHIIGCMSQCEGNVSHRRLQEPARGKSLRSLRCPGLSSRPVWEVKIQKRALHSYYTGLFLCLSSFLPGQSPIHQNINKLKACLSSFALCFPNRLAR